jgi:hypothetical protein
LKTFEWTHTLFSRGKKMFKKYVENLVYDTRVVLIKFSSLIGARRVVVSLETNILQSDYVFFPHRLREKHFRSDARLKTSERNNPSLSFKWKIWKNTVSSIPCVPTLYLFSIFSMKMFWIHIITKSLCAIVPMGALFVSFSLLSENVEGLPIMLFQNR